MLELSTYTLLALAGASAGLMAGAVGLAGGVVIVPLIVSMYGSAGMADAIVVSFFAVFFNSLSTTIGNWRSRGQHQFRQLTSSIRWYTAGALFAALAVAALFGHYRDAIPRQLLALLQLALALSLMLPRAWYAKARLRASTVRDFVVGGAVGGVSTLIGVGGGSYTIAYGLLNGRAIKDCTLTANYVGIFIGLMSLVGYFGYLGLASAAPARGGLTLIDGTGMAILVLSGIVFSQLGVRLQARLPAATIKQAIVVLLVASSLFVLGGG